MSQPLYVFDLDETLINGDCMMIWHQFLVDKGIVSQENFVNEDQRLMSLYAAGNLNMQEYLDFAIAPIGHLPIKKIDELVDQCVSERILQHLFPQAEELLLSLHEQQHTTIIISASVSFLVNSVAKQLGVANNIGIDLRKTKKNYTSRIFGVPSYQQGKVERLTKWLSTQPESYGAIHFYTDSINDLPLCQYADHVYLINPCQHLQKHIEPETWQVYDWAMAS